MKPQLSPKEIAGHEGAYWGRLANEFCFDLARQHTDHLESLGLREVLRQMNILDKPIVRLWNAEILKKAAPDAAAALSSAALAHCGFTAIQSRELRAAARSHYQGIAQALVCERPHALRPHEQNVLRQKLTAVGERATRDEMLFQRDMATVFNDPQYSLEQRRRAKRALRASRGRIAARHRRRRVEAIAASRSAEANFPPMAKRLLLKLSDLGRVKFFEQMDRTIQRYVRANIGREGWANSLPLLYLLAVEWQRDDKALWGFIEAVLTRWEEDIGDLYSVHRRSVIVHQIAPEIGRDWPSMLKKLQKIGAIEPAQSAVDGGSPVAAKGDVKSATRMQNALLMKLRKMSSRECASALKSRKRQRVKIRARGDQSAVT